MNSVTSASSAGPASRSDFETDCLTDPLVRQQPIPMDFFLQPHSTPAVVARQTGWARTAGRAHSDQPSMLVRSAAVRTCSRGDRRLAGRYALRILLLGFLWIPSIAGAQIHDSLDTHPPRWQLSGSDCQARISDHSNPSDGGLDGGGCEQITLVAGHGSEALLVYPIQPMRPIDDLCAHVSVKCVKPGVSVGFRVRYPFLRDPETHQAVSVIIYGAQYESPGEFAKIGVGLIERPLRLKNVALRNQYGREADLSDPYVDGVVINAYTGAGKTSLRLDELRIDGLVPVDPDIVTGNARSDDPRGGDQTALRMATAPADGSSLRSPSANVAFPVGSILRILQYNGEPLSWVRTLGFDAVLLPSAPDAAILREALRAQLLIYAPPPSAPSPALESMLDPVAGWYLGSGEALDSRHVESIAATAQRLRAWPERWQRPLVGAPSEAWQRYALWLDAIIDDLPPRVRGLGADEIVAQMAAMRRPVGQRVAMAIGVHSMPPPALQAQNEAIAAQIGAARPDSFRWHAMWVEVMRALESKPAAILYRSTRSLASGTPLDSQRSMALSFVNRMIASISPWLSGTTSSQPPAITGGPYRASRFTSGATELLVITTAAARGSEVLAGDGGAIEIQLTPADATKMAWRATHFSAERLSLASTPTGPILQIVSPDVVEIVMLSADPAEGGRLSQSAQRFARQASLDRWQLCTELVQRTEQAWVAATATGVVPRSVNRGLITAANRTLAESEAIYRAGDSDATLRMARRADAWALRSSWRLSEALMPDWPNPTSCPPIVGGAPDLQVMWRQRMNEGLWGPNRLTSGGLDDPHLTTTGRWQLGQRRQDQARVDVATVTRPAYQGGALRVTVSPATDQPLPGGYEGTLVQIRSPPVSVPAGTALRIDALVRTVGFGDPHQGVLVYDSIGGQELGVLLRGRSGWQPVRLYRQTIGETEVSVMFELLGAGEAIIDHVELRLWESSGRPPAPPLRPLTAERPNGAESTNR